MKPARLSAAAAADDALAGVSRDEFDAVVRRLAALEAAQAGRAGIDAYDRALLIALGEHSRGEAWRCADAIRWAATAPALKGAMREADVSTVVALAMWCRRVCDSVVDETVLRQVGRGSGGRRWRVVRTI